MSTTTKSVLELIFEWSEGLSLWKRDALRRILQGLHDAPNCADELTEILKKEIENTDQNVEVLKKEHLPATPSGGSDVSLLKISETKNVNRLASDQVLEFGATGITVVFGNNGSGKSGYTRILKNACTARHRPTILPNIYVDNSETSPSTTKITYKVGSGSEVVLDWSNSPDPNDILSAVSVFDRECAAIHVGSANEVTFRPLGLDIPEKLVDLFKVIDEKLKIELAVKQNAKNAIFLKPVWDAATSVGLFINGLTDESDFSIYETIAIFSEEDKKRLDAVQSLLNQNSKKAVTELTNKKNSVDRLIKLISEYAERYSSGKLTALCLAGNDLISKQAALHLAAHEAFGEAPLKGVGGEEWKLLWKSARSYSEAVAYPDVTFPKIDNEALCILCQQTLGDPATQRLSDFDKFVKSDLEDQLVRVTHLHTQLIKEVETSNVMLKDIITDLTSLKTMSVDAYKEVKHYWASLRQVQKCFKVCIVDPDAGDGFDGLIDAPFASLEFVKVDIDKMITEFQEAATADGLVKIQIEKNELKDKQWAACNREFVEQEINRLKEIEFLNTCLKETKTGSVTKFGNQIADEAITPQLRDNFLYEINNLVRNKFRVELVRVSGKAGIPKYKVQLVRSPKKSVPAVLSEGEQTCVAIASFFSELSTSEHTSTLVFDDPISSLDHRWRMRVAQRLAKEALSRQVIVYTHDLIFMNDLDDSCKDLGVLFNTRHIKSTPELAGIVDIDLPWDGMKIKQRIDSLEKQARRIKRDYSSLDDEAYKIQARSFYSDLRASWERGLEEVALSHTVMRHRDYINAKNVKNLSVLSEESCSTWSNNFGKCCDLTNSHDTSSGRAQEMPEPDELISDVQILSDWVSELREAHKAIAS